MPDSISQHRGPMEFWGNMIRGAAQGTLSVPSETAADCSAACDEYLALLRSMFGDVKQLAQLKSFGDLPSAQALGMKFSLKASGKPDSLDEILKQHIAIIESMRTFFGHYFTEVGGTDDHTAGTIESLTPATDPHWPESRTIDGITSGTIDRGQRGAAHPRKGGK